MSGPLPRVQNLLHGIGRDYVSDTDQIITPKMTGHNTVQSKQKINEKLDVKIQAQKKKKDQFQKKLKDEIASGIS